MTRTLDTYKRNITEVETYLNGVESNTMQQMQQMMFSRARDGGEKSAEDQVRELAAVLRDFEAGILGVAAKVGSAREQVQEVMLGPNEVVGNRGRRYGIP
jgi:nucleoporin p58/p45